MTSATAAAGSQGLWFVSRGSGLVLLVLFTVVMVLGTATRTNLAPARWPRFVVAELHRTLALIRGRAAGPARRHRDPRPVRHDRLDGHRRPVRFAVPPAGHRPRHPRRRPRRRGPDNQPGPEPARIPRMARRALAGLPGLAGGIPALPPGGHRPAHHLGGRHRMGLSGCGGDRRAGPAADHAADGARPGVSRLPALSRSSGPLSHPARSPGLRGRGAPVIMMSPIAVPVWRPGRRKHGQVRPACHGCFRKASPAARPRWPSILPATALSRPAQAMTEGGRR